MIFVQSILYYIYFNYIFYSLLAWSNFYYKYSINITHNSKAYYGIFSII